MIVPAYSNITSKVGQFLAPPGVLISEVVGVDASGQRVMYQVYRLSSGALEKRAVPVKAEHRPIVQPSNTVQSIGEELAATIAEVEKARVERRSVDRGDRDPRMPLTAVDRTQIPAGERRTGSPLQSVFQEVKSMLLTPSGIIVAGVVVVFAGFAVFRGVR